MPKIQAPFRAYSGNEPYIFVCYAHANKGLVFPLIKQLHEKGYRIWYDEGLETGTEWADNIAEHLKGASSMLLFITPKSIISDNVKDEIHYAINEKIPVAPVFLQKTKLEEGLKLRLNRYTSTPYYEFSNDEAFFEKLLRTKLKLFAKCFAGRSKKGKFTNLIENLQLRKSISSPSRDMMGERNYSNTKVLKPFPQQGALSELERERLQHKTFLRSRTKTYIAAQENYDVLNRFVESDARAIVIEGESGMGKSALLANWIEEYAKKLPGKLIYHFVGNSAAEGDYRKIMQRLIDEIRDIYTLSKPADNDLQKLDSEKGSGDKDRQKEELQQLLAQIASKERLLIVLDGMNQLADTDNAKLLNWLPTFPNNVKVIYSTTTGDETQKTFLRRGYTTHTLKPLTPEERTKLITNYLKGYGKSLSPKPMKQIAENKMMENTLVLRTLLEELRVSGVYEKLDKQITRYLDAPDIPTFFDLVLERLETAYNYDKTNFVGDVFSLLAVSRAGFSETELLAITGVAPLYWSQLRAAISMHLVTKNGLLSFSHQFLRDAVWKRYLSDKETEETENSFRKKIVDYCKGQKDSPRIYDELPHQYYELRMLDELYDKILFPPVFGHFLNNSENILYKYWKILYDTDVERYSIKKYVDRLKKSEYLSQENLVGTLFDYAYFLHGIKHYNECLTLYEDVLKIYRELTNSAAYLPAIAMTLNNLAALHYTLHCYERAEKEFAEALEIRREFAKANPDAFLSEVAITLNNLTNLHRDLHRYEEAEKEFAKALEIYGN
jgi:tetratricopeptide (TPR) repeat protein